VEPHVALWKHDEPESARLLDGADWVVDAIDNIGTKVELLRECKKRGIKVRSSDWLNLAK
jgi:tRNA A37 threonylcarbamoyladenosine dehydratase